MNRRGADASDELPVARALPALLDALAEERSAAVVVAEPGAGKTTLVPPALLDAPWCARRVVLVEPRRLAARSAASRIAARRGERVGQAVGWRMRGDTRVSRATRLEVVTDGVLTRLLQSDPALDGIDAIVFDEFHERSLDTDVGLALCLDVRSALRPDLRLVAMSATIDGAAVAGLLDTETVLRVPGRNHPVDTVWVDDAPRAFDPRAVARVCRRALHDTDRDVLVFLPGAAEIRAVQAALHGIENDGVDVLPLHGSLPFDAQDRALSSAPPGRRKVVLSTSIAETSLTIDGVDAVVDSGWSRGARFDLRRGMGGLVTTRVSQASAEQRQGRAGRTASGRCYRMWSAADHSRLPAHDQPEIVTDDLAPLALDLVRWGDADASTLHFLDPPPPVRLDAARMLLRQLELIDDRNRLTAHGRSAATLPLHPRLAHGVRRAADLGHGTGACLVAAALSESTRADVRDTADLLARLQRPQGQTRQQARRLAREVGVPEPGDGSVVAAAEAAGLTVGFSYPDRIARRRGATTRYVLSGGGGAELDRHDPLARNEWLAIAELDLLDGRGDARILAAVALDELDLAEVASGLAVTDDVVEWDRQLRDVRAERRTRIGAIVVSTRPIDPGADAAAALLDGLRFEGLALLPGWSSTSVYRARVAFCRGTFGDEWPDLSEATLAASADEWLTPWLAVARRRADLARVDVAGALASIVGARLQARLGELAPRELALPSGRTRRIDYDDGVPIVRLRVQDAFGWSESPRIAGGRVPVVLHLLSPADRPVQVTGDLAGFWRGSYAAVRAEMRGRYPKHAWPEDPVSSSPPRPRA